MNKYSIIIPVYNSQEYIGRCLDSILKQTYKEFEIIIVDDGSVDNSKKICDEYQGKDKRITVIHKKNQGVSIARNIGIEKAKNEYIIFVDSDDTIKEDMLEKINEIYTKNSELDVLIYNYSKKEKIKENGLLEFLSEAIKTEKINVPWNKVYRKSICEKRNIRFNEKISIGEDLLFNIEYFKWVKKIYTMEDKLYNYNVYNSNSLTRKYIANKYEQLMLVNDEMKNWLKTYNNNQLMEIAKYIRLKNILSCIKDVSCKKCNMTEFEKINYVKDIKKKNKGILVRTIGMREYIISLLYCCVPCKILMKIFKLREGFYENRNINFTGE